MKYKVGDKILVEAEVIEIDHSDEEFPINVVYENGSESWVLPELIHGATKFVKTYEQGLQDAWELLDRLEHAVSVKVMDDVFGYSEIGDILDNYTPQEALAKLKAYEEAQTIKVGDLVEYEECPYLITYTYGNVLRGMSKDGIGIVFHTNDDVKKTGKHIDIAGLLEQIRG